MPILPYPPVIAGHDWRSGYIHPADQVSMAFTAVDVSPASGDWRGAEWETTQTTNGYKVACLIGSAPGTSMATHHGHATGPRS